jgi:hypothetical protein
METSLSSFLSNIGFSILQRTKYVCNQIVSLSLPLALPLKNPGVAKDFRIYFLPAADSTKNSKLPPAHGDFSKHSENVR